MNTDLTTSTIITVYTKPACPQCDATKRYLVKHHVPFAAVDVTREPAMYAYVQSLGYSAAPVIVTPTGEHWSGFRPDRLKAAALPVERAA